MAENIQQSGAAWRPLTHAVFRALWLAALASNLGTLMQGVGATWLMTSLTSSPVPIALLTTMGSLPILLVGLPAGALADVVDRRWLVIWTQVWMLAVAAVLAGLTLLNWMSPAILLGLTFLLAMGGALSAPAWQAIVPDLVPRSDLAAAIAINSAGFNLARAVGPALGGLLVAAAGPASVFLLNAASFIGVIVVIYSWKPATPERKVAAEPMRGAIAAGTRFARHSPPLRAVLARTAAFIVAASAIWALLPVLATRRLGLEALGYGVLLGSIGVGAVAGAFILPRLRERWTSDRIVVILSAVFAIGMFVVAASRNLVVVNLALIAVGVGWLTITSCLNVTAQTIAPAWVQARVLGVYLLVFQGGLAGGSAAWGFVADHLGERDALFAAAGLLVVGLLAALRWRLISGEELDLSPSQHWPEPDLAVDVEADDGPVMITVEYRVAQADQPAFCGVMADMQLIRLRDGALRWDLFRDAADPERLLETFVARSWAEHLRQHERFTVMDREVEERALALQQSGTTPSVAHFISTPCVRPAEVDG